MKKNMIERLYCLSFSQQYGTVNLIPDLVDTFCKALGLKMVFVYEVTGEGYRLVAASPAKRLDYAQTCRLENCLCFSFFDPARKKRGELCLILKRKGFLSDRKRRLIDAFGRQLAMLLAEEGESNQQSCSAEIEKYKYLLTRDTLTGLYNRYYFEEAIKVFENGKMYPVSIIMIDVDGLKIINDTMGHRSGDELLIAAATVLKKVFREEDVIARIGGDEFAVLLPSTPQVVVEQRCQLLREVIQKHNRGKNFPYLSLSAGYATTSGLAKPIQTILDEADQMMYKEKFKHHNQIKYGYLTCSEPYTPAFPEEQAPPYQCGPPTIVQADRPGRILRFQRVMT